MRKLTITTSPQTGAPKGEDAGPEQVTELLALWSGLGSAGLTVEASALLPLLTDNARFVISMARQYQNQGVSQEVLVKNAHAALLTILNHYAGRPEKLSKVMVLAIRNSMITTIQTQDIPHS